MENVYVKSIYKYTNIYMYMYLYLSRARNTIKRHLNARVVFCATHNVASAHYNWYFNGATATATALATVRPFIMESRCGHQQWPQRNNSYGFALNIDVFLLWFRL